MAKSTQDLKKFYDQVAACNRCGFCTSYCPTYNATGSEAHSPRGRNQAFRALIEGKISHPHQTKDIIDTCILCGECTAVCFSEVPTAHLMVQARQVYNERYGIPPALSFVLKKLLPNPGLLKFILKLAFIGKKLKISWLLKKMGVLKKVAPTLAAADDLVSDVPFKFLLEHSETKPYNEKRLEKAAHGVLLAQKEITTRQKKKQHISRELIDRSKAPVAVPRVAMLPVCGNQYLKPAIGVSTIKLFEALDVDLLIPNILCCGLPAASYGVLDQVQEFAKENIERIERGGFEHIVVDDSSCAAHIKEYPKYFPNDPAWFDRASKISRMIRDVSSFFLERGLTEKLKRKKWHGGPVAYHDPCKAQYGQNVRQAPRDLLSAIPGLTLVPVLDADQCCGGGGTYSFVHPEMSQSILWKKVENLLQSGAHTIVTSSASCYTQLAFGLAKVNPSVKIFHITEFLARAL